MPNRIIKESVCTSDNIDNLSPQEEVFFYRLVVNCDDHGRMDARPPILRSKCFPLKVDQITDQDIQEWLQSLVREDLIYVYKVEGREYLQMKTWDKHQQKRAKHSKYPSPEDGEIHLISSDINCNQKESNVPENREYENTRIRESNSTCPDSNPSPDDDGENTHENEQAEPKFDEDSPSFKAACYLVTKILDNNPRARVPNKDPSDRLMQKWANELDRLNRLGPPGSNSKGYSWQEIRDIIDWCQQDQFWAANILSAAKLREKIVTLEAHMKRSRASPTSRKQAEAQAKMKSVANLYQKYKEEESREEVSNS